MYQATDPYCNNDLVRLRDNLTSSDTNQVILSIFSVLCGKHFTIVWFCLVIISGENFQSIQMTVIVFTVVQLKSARCDLTELLKSALQVDTRVSRGEPNPPQKITNKS